MRRSVKVLLTFGLVALLASPVLAQQQRQRQGGGRGGFGAALLQNPDVQKELKITDDQKEKLTKISADIREKHKDDLAKARDLSQEDRAKLMKEISDESSKAYSEVLSADQMKRYKQIQLQQRGAGAFSDPEVQQTLKLTDDQKSKLKTINEDSRKEMQEAFQSAQGGDRQAAQKKIQTLRKDTMDKASAVLTDDQKKAWKDMTGEHFELTAGPGGAGAGRRPRNNNNQ
jgi:Spy/CpxP family protein refolding chaperone